MTKTEVILALAKGEGCLGQSQGDEPVFILCARDICAAETVRYWVVDAEQQGIHSGKVNEARALADAMDEWRKVNILGIS